MLNDHLMPLRARVLTIQAPLPSACSGAGEESTNADENHWLARYLARRRRRSRIAGFTLVEMLIVAIILGTVATIAFPMLQFAVERARVARAIGDVRAIQTDILTYQAGGNGLPESLADIGRDEMEDPWGYNYRYLNFFPEGSGGGGGGQGKGKGGGGGGGGPPPQGARKDRFLVPVNSEFDLYSLGKDGASVPAFTAKASKDDVVRANDGGFIGLAEKF